MPEQQYKTSSGPAWGATLCGMSMEWTGMRNNKWAPPRMGYDEPLSPATGNKIALPCVFQVNHPKFFFFNYNRTINTAKGNHS